MFDDSKVKQSLYSWCVDCVNWMLFIQDLATGQHWTNILVRSQIIHKEVWAMQNYRSFNIFRNVIISKQTHRSRSEYPNVSILARCRLHKVVNHISPSVLAAALGQQTHWSKEQQAIFPCQVGRDGYAMKCNAQPYVFIEQQLS